jgi:hypothetical protein
MRAGDHLARSDARTHRPSRPKVQALAAAVYIPAPRMSAAPPVALGPLRRALMSALAISIIYGNLAVVLNPEKLGFPGWPALPRPFAIQDAFLIPGMFSGYARYNFDMVLQGQRTEDGRAADRGRWIDLPLHEFFPQRDAIVYTQLFAAHHWDMLGDREQRRAWAELARRIERRHNRLHPDAEIRRVRFGTLNFPLSPDGYRAAKIEGKTWSELWYRDR